MAGPRPRCGWPRRATGCRLADAHFAATSWDLKRWLWLPVLGCHGPFKITPFQHMVVTSGVGVSGGSLVYANTLAIPGPGFFTAPSWGHLADWRAELAHVFGYANMYVCDGSAISANLGVNPALTTLALTERAMARIPPAQP